MSENLPYRWHVTENQKIAADQVAALLGLGGNGDAVSKGLKLILDHAKAHAKGKTKVVFCKPELAALLENNEKFIEALCEEGVVEWLTPFVLTKSKQGGIAQSTTPPNEP